MRPCKLLSFVSLVFLIPSQGFGEAQCPGTIAPIRLLSLDFSQIAIPVTINHVGPFEFLLDTGSQITIMEPSLAEELHLKPGGDVPVVTLTTSFTADLVVPDLIEVGSHAVRQPFVAVQKMAQLQALDPHLRGILGGDFLSHFDLLVDQRQKLLCLDQSGLLRESVRGERIPMAPQSGQPGDSPSRELVVIQVDPADNRSKKMVLTLDSGTNVPMLYAKPTYTPAALIWGAQAQRAIATGDCARYFVTLPAQSVQIGTHTLNEIAFIVPLDSTRPAVRSDADGLLPTGLFKRFFISYAAGYVVFNPPAIAVDQRQ